MKKGLWLIFKCQNCGKVFQEKPPKGMAVPFYAEITRKKGVSKGKVKHIASISTAAKKKHVKDDKGGPKK